MFRDRYAPPQLLLLFSLVFVAPARSDGASSGAEQALVREIFAELINIDTTDSVGDNTKAAEAMAKRLLAAGLPASDVQVLAPRPRKGNLVARLRGTGARRPLLLLAHLDVVEARREDWSFDPFVFREEGGYFYGRGTTDDKSMAAQLVATFIRYRKEGFRPDRDLVLALTADEEGGDSNGVAFLLEKHRPLIEAELGLNEGGGGGLRKGRRLALSIQASEKVFQSFRLEVKNPGGHSSLPVPENAIYRLAEGLTRLAKFHFPVRLNEVTREFFRRTADALGGPEAAAMKAILAEPPDPSAAAALSQQPYFNSLMRTTCVATQLAGGHAENALPQMARAVVNCRMLPDEAPGAVREAIVKVLADPQIQVTAVADAKPSPPSPLTPEVLGPVERLTAAMWPGVPVVPVMSTGATDSLYLRAAGIPMYGVDGMFSDLDDVRAHGRDERLPVSSLYEGQEFLYRLVKAMSSSEGGR
jgi:acetylornithine deacetylase/succinyl-diaminopimelate desuccinylase-like protein